MLLSFTKAVIETNNSRDHKPCMEAEMMKLKPLILILMAIVLSLALLSACAPTAAVEEGDVV